MNNIIEFHQRVASRLHEAANLHLKAAMQNEMDNKDNAYISTIKAHIQTIRAYEEQKEMLQNHALEK
jgi:hypothetical protein